MTKGTVLSFDIATEKTGYAVLENGSVIESGVLVASGHFASDRFEKMADGILEVLARVHPEICIAEAPFSGKNKQASVYLYKLHGVLEYECTKAGVSFHTFAIPSWRSEMGFPSNIRKPKDTDFKALSKKVAGEVCGREFLDDNESDAVCIGVGYWKRKMRQQCNLYKQ